MNISKKTFKTVAATAILASVLSMGLTACESTNSGAKTQANGCSAKHSCKGNNTCKGNNSCNK